MKRTIVFALAWPVAVWLGIVVFGKKAGDVAGEAVFDGPGFLVNAKHGLLVESMAAGALAAYLTAG